MKIKTKAFVMRMAIPAFLLFAGGAPLAAQSVAHEKSAFAIIDPTYSAEYQSPEPVIKTDEAPWIYGQGELECYRLQLLMQRKDSAKLLVGYPGVFHHPSETASFRLILADPATLKTIRFRAAGEGKVFVNNAILASFGNTGSDCSFPVASGIKISELRFELMNRDALPALLIEEDMLSTSSGLWEWKAEAGEWQPAASFPQNDAGIPPHQLEDPTVKLKPVGVINGLYDFGCELFGVVRLQSKQKPRLFVGESKAEALDTTDHVREQSLEMVKAADGRWISAVPLAFRYAYVPAGQTDDLECQAIFHPVAYRGAFACSDSTLTRIWMSSAYTLRLCMHDFILDGIKRDRLPWTGDLAMSMLVNAYTFSDPWMVQRSLVALGRAGIGEKDINGIIDYSLWWVIAQDHYQLYFGDSTHLSREWNRIRETLRILSTRCDSSGFLIPDKTWLFIDWVNQKKWTALQVLWWWAQESGARLAHRMDDFETEERLKNTAELLKINLIKGFWNTRDQFWNSDIKDSGNRTRHPNFLAVVSGLAGEDQFDGIRKLLVNEDVDAVGTPYMAGFENMALARLGNLPFMLERVRRYWGGMLDQGATTFWEAYDSKQKGNEQYSFYDRPYGKSLCHAWSSGPAAVLPSGIFGLLPLEDGWKRFSINPRLGKLEWAYGTIPTKYGDIRIALEKGSVNLTIPKGTTLEWKGKSITGPVRIKYNL